MKKLTFQALIAKMIIASLLLQLSFNASAERIKDIASVAGVRANQ